MSWGVFCWSRFYEYIHRIFNSFRSRQKVGRNTIWDNPTIWDGEKVSAKNQIEKNILTISKIAWNVDPTIWCSASCLILICKYGMITKQRRNVS